jgi:hypothetical protein
MVLSLQKAVHHLLAQLERAASPSAIGCTEGLIGMGLQPQQRWWQNHQGLTAIGDRQVVPGAQGHRFRRD